MFFMTYNTKSQSRNVLASPLGEEGHEVAKGWTRVILIMILDVDVTAEGGLIKLIAPSRGNERYEGKKASHILHVPFRRFPPLVAGAITLPGGKHVTGFSGRFALLQIQFLCHLKGKRENRWHWILCYI